MIKRVIILIIIFFIFLVCLEQGIRFYLFGFRSFNFTLMSSIAPLGETDFLKKSSFPDLRFELKPNLDSFFKLARFRTNSDGLRDREYQIKKPENTFRVVVLGSSLTMACGIDIDDAFHSLLENRLNNESSNTSYEFINFGVGGYDLLDCLAMLKYKALKYEPDLIFFCTDVREPNLNREKSRTNTKYNKMKRQSFFRSYLIEFASRNKVLSFFAKKKEPNSNIADDHDVNDKIRDLEILENIFLQLGAISKQYNVPVCLVRNNYFINKNREETEKLALKYGLYYVDTSYAFKKGKVKDYIIYKIDAHPNAAAHKIFASILYDYLKEKRLLERNK